MSLRDKFTDEEWNAIPPFTGFHHNKVKEELLENAAQTIKDRCDNLAYYDADKKPLTHEDEVSPFGKVNLWDFEPLTTPGIKSDYPSINKDIAEAFDLVVEKFKNENTIQMDIEKREIIIQQIVDKVKIERTEGRTPRVILMSVSDYDIFHDPNNNESKYYYKNGSSENNKSGIYYSGFKMIIHKCITAEDGEIEIY